MDYFTNSFRADEEKKEQRKPVFALVTLQCLMHSVTRGEKYDDVFRKMSPCEEPCFRNADGKVERMRQVLSEA